MVNENYQEQVSHAGIGDSIRARLDGAREDMYDAGIQEPQATRAAMGTLDLSDPLQARIAQSWYREGN